VPTAIASAGSAPSRAAEIGTAGQVCVLVRAETPKLNTGNATAWAPAGQRPRAGTRASCAHDIRPVKAAGSAGSRNRLPTSAAGMVAPIVFVWITTVPRTPLAAFSTASCPADGAGSGWALPKAN
jgi:hypothetical protein